MSGSMRLLAAVGLSGMLVVSADARGLLGERYAVVGGGVVFVENEDVKEFDDTQVFYGAGVQVPVCEYADISLNIARSELEGDDGLFELEATTQGIGVSVTAHGKLTGKVDPFASVGAAYIESEVEVSLDGAGSVDDDDEDGFYDLDVGVQIDLGNDFAIAPIAELNDIGDDETFQLTLAANKWLTKTVGLGASVARDFDDGNVSLEGDLRIAF